MKDDRWQEIDSARRRLQLPTEVTRREIREAYRRRSREIHPDGGRGQEGAEAMAKLNSAYKTLMDYVETYTIRLSPNEDGMTEREWWMHRFGQDPLWVGDREED